MQFYPLDGSDKNVAQIEFWTWLKKNFATENGVSYYRFPIFYSSGNKKREPDVVVAHPELGIWVFEIKGCRIENIDDINGQEWRMKDFYSEYIFPDSQASDGLQAVQSLVNQQRSVRDLDVRFQYRIILPLISRKDWEARGFNHNTAVGSVCLEDDLKDGNLLRTLRRTRRNTPFSDLEWSMVLSALRGSPPVVTEPRTIATNTPAMSPVRVMNAIEQLTGSIDESQHAIACVAPDGPQRLRGLAGTGKTVVLAIRAAILHARNPDWSIAFVFYTKSIENQVRSLIETHYGRITRGGRPDWTKLKVMGSWGGKSSPGFYFDVARKNNVLPKTYDTAISLSGNHWDGFENICKELNSGTVEEYYDAILVDEGQDLPPSFYQLAYKALKKPKRLYWAYDEAQSLVSLAIPNSREMFGFNKDGTLRVDMSGSYDGGTLKSYKMNRVYRTPRKLLMYAHAINMGLYRRDGVLQGVSTQRDWESLGYHVVEGDFSPASVAARSIIKISRGKQTSIHPINKTDFPYSTSIGEPFVFKKFETAQDEISWVANSIRNDILSGFKPEDILVTSINSEVEKSNIKALENQLTKNGIKLFRAGESSINGKPDAKIFKQEGFVTQANIHRAKGNEAWKVYVLSFHNIRSNSEHNDLEKEMKKRNEAFVSITRSKVWCVVSGLDGSPIFDELQSIGDNYPNFVFPAFNKSSLCRITDEL